MAVFRLVVEWNFVDTICSYVQRVYALQDFMIGVVVVYRLLHIVDTHVGIFLG
jgi:hypothetical protein